MSRPITFAERHIGPSDDERARMLSTLGLATLDELVDRVVPKGIRQDEALRLPPAATETGASVHAEFASGIVMPGVKLAFRALTPAPGATTVAPPPTAPVALAPSVRLTTGVEPQALAAR